MSNKTPAILSKQGMRLHTQNWFIVTSSSLTTYNEEELKLLWDTFSTPQLDFIQEMCENSYKAGYTAAEQDR